MTSSSGNVLIVLVDDLGVEKLASYGAVGALPSTPVIDVLAAQGVRFDNVWSNPACSPTRATIQTGRYAFRTGMGWAAPLWDGLALSETTIPEMLDLGTGGQVAHAAIGKWHLGDADGIGGVLAPNLAGYDHYSGAPENIGDYYQFEKIVNGVVSDSTTYTTTEEVDDALAFVTTAPEPWFCYLALHAPHTPFHAPPPSLHSVDLSQAGPPEDDPLPYYNAMVEAVDTELGRLLSGLGAKLGRTTVIFLADNGTSPFVVTGAGSAKKAKWTVFEGGVRVPMIISGPTVAHPGSVCSALVNTTDLFATVAELAGAGTAHVPADSVSVAPYLVDPGQPSRREAMFTEIFLPNGVQFAQPVVPNASPFVCQTDLGMGGPGTAMLSVCGQELATGNRASIELTGAPPNAATTLLLSYSNHPAPSHPFSMFGGTVGPRPPWESYLPTQPVIDATKLVTDASGSIQIDGLSAWGPVYLHAQARIDDPQMSGGYQLSNAVSIAFWPYSMKAIRGARYKYTSSINGGPEQLFDLMLDPDESDDLLLHASLQPEELAALDELRNRLLALISGA